MVNPPPSLAFTRNEISFLASTNLSNTFFTVRILDVDSKILASLILTPDSVTGQASVNISQILDDNTLYSIDLQNRFSHNQQSLLQYIIRIIEGTADEPIESIDFGPYYALKGGIAMEFDTDPFAYLRNNKRFLTHAKSLKVLPEQPYLIDCIWDQTAQNMIAKAKIFYTDNTDYTVTLNDYGLINQYSIIRVDAGFYSNNLQTHHPDKTAYKYEISIRDQVEEKEFEIMVFLDHDYKYKPRFFMYGNSLGGLDACYLTGQNIVNLSVDFQTAEYHSVSGIKTVSFGHLLKNSPEIASGYKTQDEIRLIVEIALNGFSFELLYNGVMVPIIIDADSNFIVSEKENLHSVVLKYTRALVNRSFTPDDFIGELPNEYNFDYNSEYTS